MQKRQVVSAVCLVAIVLLMAGICVIVWRKTSDDSDSPSPPQAFSSVNLTQAASLHVGQDHIDLNFRNYVSGEDRVSQQVYLGYGVNHTDMSVSNDWSVSKYLAFQWLDGTNLTIQNIPLGKVKMSCISVRWEMANGSLETPPDCFDMKHSYWYGGFEDANQYWPINNGEIPNSPFVTGDGFVEKNTGDVIEGIFVSSAGVGIYIHENSSSYISVNSGGSKLLCLNGKTGLETPYFDTHGEPVLMYDICHARDVSTLWKEMAKRYLPKPNGIPSEDVIRYPIWSTWARYKGFVNQSKVLDFANEIQSHDFGISQLEIDDNWTPGYGNFTFDTHKFPAARDMILNLAHQNIPVTVWMHPFFNNDTGIFAELDELGYLLRSPENTNQSALTSWWRGKYAGVLDVTNHKATEWYLDKLNKLQEHFNVTSFKFDAGELNYLPKKYVFQNPLPNPCYFSKLYAQLAYNADQKRRQEVRVGFKSQELPILVRMIDRMSNWGHDKGLKTLIPCALTFGLMGYPFILPDMVGGNAYDPDDLDKTVLPDPELFVRWLQATALMPTLQFSIPPWSYNSTIIDISRKFTKLHESFADKIIALAVNSMVKGEPILKPIWWLAPDDDTALQTDTEFLLGNDVLVAPVLEKGAVSRDIYLPKGRWLYEHGPQGKYQVHIGPRWLKDFPAALDVLPFFTKVHF